MTTATIGVFPSTGPNYFDLSGVTLKNITGVSFFTGDDTVITAIGHEGAVTTYDGAGNSSVVTGGGDKIVIALTLDQYLGLSDDEKAVLDAYVADLGGDDFIDFSTMEMSNIGLVNLIGGDDTVVVAKGHRPKDPSPRSEFRRPKEGRVPKAEAKTGRTGPWAFGFRPSVLRISDCGFKFEMRGG